MPLPFLPGWVVARGYYQVRWRHTHRHCGECGGELQLAYIGSHPWSFSGPDRLPAGFAATVTDPTLRPDPPDDATRTRRPVRPPAPAGVASVVRSR